MRLQFIIFILCLTILGCKDSSINTNTDTIYNKVSISIKQNGIAIEPENGSIKLEKEAFEIVVHYQDQNQILVNSSFNEELLLKALNEEDLSSEPQFTLGHLIAENFYNPEKSIYVSDEGTSAWIQDVEGQHMFNTLESEDGVYHGTKMIENIFDLDENQNIPVQFVDKPLNFVFLMVDTLDLNKNVELQRICLKIKWVDNGISENLLIDQFNDHVKSTPIQSLPFVESTNFNNKNTRHYLNNEEMNILKLGKVYPNLYTAGYHYKSSISYRLDISTQFVSLVVTTEKGDDEIATVLLNYTTEGDLIDHKVIAYDEIVDDSKTYLSTIDNHKMITKTSVHYEEYLEEPEFFKIDEKGYIETIYLNDVILTKLDMTEENIYEDFSNFIEVSNSKTVVLLAKINKQTVDQTDLDAYILIVNPLNGMIESRLIQEKRWIIDAVSISAIEVEYNPFKVSSNSETVGVKVYYLLDNPIKLYLSNEYNLYERNGYTFKEILRDYEVGSHHEDIDDQGNSEVLMNTKTFLPIENDSLPYYNLEITNELIEKRTTDGTLQYLDKSKIKETLIYESGKYKLAVQD